MAAETLAKEVECNTILDTSALLAQKCDASASKSSQSWQKFLGEVCVLPAVCPLEIRIHPV